MPTTLLTQMIFVSGGIMSDSLCFSVFWLNIMNVIIFIKRKPFK